MADGPHGMKPAFTWTDTKYIVPIEGNCKGFPCVPIFSWFPVSILSHDLLNEFLLQGLVAE